MSKREINKLLANYKELETREKEVKAEKEKIKAVILKEMQENELLNTGVYKVTNTKYERAGFDNKAFKESHARLYEKFKTLTTCFRFSVVEL